MNDIVKINDILKDVEHKNLKLNIIREVSGSNIGSLEALRLSIFEALRNYDQGREMARAILEISGMEEVIIDELESMGFIVSSSS